MRKVARPVAAVTVTVAVAATLFALGCDTHRVEEIAVQEHSFELEGDGRNIEVRLASGSVQVSSSPTGKVEVVVRSRARSIDRDSARGLLQAHPVEVRQTVSGVSIEGRETGARTIALGGVDTDVSIRSPQNVDLRIRTDDGRVEVEGVEGAVLAESGDGRIVVRELRGRIVLHTSDGSIVARGIDGELEATSEDGSIEAEGRFDTLRIETGDGRIRVRTHGGSLVASAWLVRSADGSVELSLPDGMNATLEAVTSDGDIVNDVEGFRGSGTDHRLEGTVGSGGGTIVVSTMDGSITLR